MSSSLIERISESQDGNPLKRYVRNWEGVIEWDRFKDVDAMSVGDALNLLLLKIAAGETPADDMEYTQKQLGQAALIVFADAIAKETVSP